MVTGGMVVVTTGMNTREKETRDVKGPVEVHKTPLEIGS